MESDYAIDASGLGTPDYFEQIVFTGRLLKSVPKKNRLEGIFRKYGRMFLIHFGDSIDDLEATREGPWQFVPVNPNAELRRILESGSENVYDLEDVVKFGFPAFGPPVIACFDIDGTLTKGITNLLFVDYLVGQRILPEEIKKRMDELGEHYKQQKISYHEFRYRVNDTYAQAVKGRLVHAIYQNALEFAHKHVELQPNALDLVQRVRQQAVKVIGVTSSPLEIVEPLNRYFHFHELLATELEIAHQGQKKIDVIPSQMVSR